QILLGRRGQVCFSRRARGPIFAVRHPGKIPHAGTRKGGCRLGQRTQAVQALRRTSRLERRGPPRPHHLSHRATQSEAIAASGDRRHPAASPACRAATLTGNCSPRSALVFASPQLREDGFIAAAFSWFFSFVAANLPVG